MVCHNAESDKKSQVAIHFFDDKREKKIYDRLFFVLERRKIMNITKMTTIAALALLTAACSGPLCQTRTCSNKMVVSDAAVAAGAATAARTRATAQGPVLFAFDSAELTSAGQSALNPYANYLVKNADKKAEISGYTDSTGSEEYNLKLSQRRAESAKAYLVNKGVAANRLTAKGYGKTNFVADNKTANGRAQNRRIEIEVK